MRIGAGVVDYALIFVYFAVVLLVGVAARRRVSGSLDFFLPGRSLPAWITELAFVSWSTACSAVRCGWPGRWARSPYG